MASTINASSTGGGGLITSGDASGELALQANGVTQATVTSTGLSLASTASINALNTFGFENRIINGAMVISQSAAGASVTSTSGKLYATDRFFIVKDSGTTGVMTAQQSSTAPVGFTNSVKLTTTTAQASLGATDFVRYSQIIEGYNVADLGFGTANANTVTLSFWVQSSLTGTFGGSLGNSAWDRTYPFTYTISVANTWEYKTVTIAGDTSGTWLTTNGIGLRVDFGLGVGSTYSGTAGAWTGSLKISATGATSVVGTNAATWYVTGVQLEKGSQATSFDFRSIGTELALCQRYLPAFTAQSGTTGPLPGIATALGTNCVLIFNHPVPARVPGTGVTVSSNSHFNFSNNDGNSASTAVSFAAGSPNASQLSITVAVTRGATTTPGWFYANNASAILYITGCEL